MRIHAATETESGIMYLKKKWVMIYNILNLLFLLDQNILRQADGALNKR